MDLKQWLHIILSGETLCKTQTYCRFAHCNTFCNAYLNISSSVILTNGVTYFSLLSGDNDFIHRATIVFVKKNIEENCFTTTNKLITTKIILIFTSKLRFLHSYFECKVAELWETIKLDRNAIKKKKFKSRNFFAFRKLQLRNSVAWSGFTLKSYFVSLLLIFIRRF